MAASSGTVTTDAEAVKRGYQQFLFPCAPPLYDDPLVLVDGRGTKALLEAANDEQLLIGVGGLHGQVIRLGPSILVTEAEVADALGRLERACARVSS